MLFITTKHLTLFDPRHAAYALQKGDEGEATVRITSYYDQMDAIRKAIADRFKLLRENMFRFRDWRLAKVSDVRDKDPNRSMFADAFMESGPVCRLVLGG